MALLFSCGKPNDEGSQPQTSGIEPSAQSQAVFSSGISFESKADFVSVGFTASDSWTLDVTDTKASSWLTVQPTAGAAGKANVSVSAPANPTTAERSATVTIRCGGVSRQFRVKQAGMPVVEVTSVTLDRASLEVEVGKVKKLSATVNPSDATDPGLSWSSSSDAIATVDGEGNVKGIAQGTATITVQSRNGKSATCQVTVVTPSADNSEGYEGSTGEWD